MLRLFFLTDNYVRLNLETRQYTQSVADTQTSLLFSWLFSFFFLESFVYTLFVLKLNLLKQNRNDESYRLLLKLIIYACTIHCLYVIDKVN